MNVPEEFKRLTQCFWQGSDREAANEDDWIIRSLNLCGDREQAVIKAFLTNVLDEDPSVGELQAIWKCGGASYGIYDEHVREFFERIRDLAKD